MKCEDSATGIHCWHANEEQHMMCCLDALCCWCGARKCVRLEEEEGHGPHAARLRVPSEFRKAFMETGNDLA